MALILAAHGTRSPGGVAMIEGLAAQASTLAHRPVEVAFVDVLGPTPSEVLERAKAAGRPAIVVPAFLARISRPRRPARPCRGQWTPQCARHPSFEAKRSDCPDRR
jgi:hypothetical protein